MRAKRVCGASDPRQASLAGGDLAVELRAQRPRRRLAQLAGMRVDLLLGAAALLEDNTVHCGMAPWTNTRIVRLADAHQESAALKPSLGRDIVALLGRVRWHDLLVHELVGGPRLTIFRMIASEGAPSFDGQPDVTLRLLGPPLARFG
jgi:hypothetical protein